MAGKRYFETMSKVSPAGLSDAQLRIVRMTGLHAGTMAKAFRGTASPRAAIKAKCLDCAGFDIDAIRGCRINACPLHGYRPFRMPFAGPGAAEGAAPGE